MVYVLKVNFPTNFLICTVQLTPKMSFPNLILHLNCKYRLDKLSLQIQGLLIVAGDIEINPGPNDENHK